MTFACPHCRRLMEVDDAGAGEDVACPHCGRELTVPAARTITRHHLEWMGFCGKFCAIPAAIAGAVVGYRIKSGITLPDDSAVVAQSHLVECVVLGVIGAAAGLVIGAVFGILLGLFVAKFTNPGSCPD